MTTWLPGARLVLTHGLAVRPLRARLARDQAGGDQHRRVGGVGAAGDRGDHDVAIADVEALALDRRRAGRCASCRCRSSSALNWSSTSLSSTRSCGRLGPASDGSIVRHVELERVGEQRLGRRRRRATGPAPGIGLGPARSRSSSRPVSSQIFERPLVDREEAAGRAIFGRHVGDGRAVGDASVLSRPGP